MPQATIEATKERARARFAALTAEGRDYCARNGADEYCQSESPPVRLEVARLCREWLANPTYTILVREGKIGPNPWRQYLVITDGRVAIVEMTPALFGGWNFGRVDIQSGRDWSDWPRESIVTWKLTNDVDGLTKHAEISPEFKAKLLARAGL